MSSWNKVDWARFLICSAIGLVLLEKGIGTFQNPTTFYDPVVSIIEIAVALFFVGVGLSPEETFGFLEAVLDLLRDILDWLRR